MKIYLNAQDNPRTWNKKNYLLRAQERMGGTNFADLNSVSYDRPEFVLNIEPCEFVFGSKWTGLWHIDNLVGDEKYYAYNLFDTVFTADLSDSPKAMLLLQACDPEMHRRIPEIKQEYDFVICGSSLHTNNIWQKRKEAWAELKKHFTYKEFTPPNDGWTEKLLPHQQYIEAQNMGKVQFIHSMWVNGRGEIAQRFFECLAIGPVLTNYTKELEHTGLVEDEDYMCYNDKETMLNKMHLLINDEALRNKIAESGRRKALLYHSYESRLGSIFNVAKQYA